MKGERPRLRPFQNIQVDFTEIQVDFAEMLRVGKLRYLLIIVCHFSGWVEAFSLVAATTGSVIKIILV